MSDNEAEAEAKAEAEALTDLCFDLVHRIGNVINDVHKTMDTFPEIRGVLKIICRVQMADDIILECIAADKNTAKKMGEHLNELASH